MKRIFLIALAAASISFASCNKAQDETATAEATATPAATGAKFEYYGDSIATTDAMTVAQLMEKAQPLADEDSVMARIEGEILESCANKGCWVSIKAPNDEALTIRFKNYGFFVPTEGLEKKTLVAEGRTKWVVSTVEELREEAKEEGKTAQEIAAITKPERTLQFIASGVAIRD